MIITSTKFELSTTQKLVLCPIGDIHYNAPGHDRERFTDVIKWIADTAKRPDRKVVVLLMGDYLDTFSSSERRGLQGGFLHDSSRLWLERKILQDMDAMVEALSPVAHLVGSVLAGNHTFRFQEMGMGALVGKTTSQVLAERLNAPFMGICGSLVLEMHRPGSSRMENFKILMHHGFGNASTKQTSIGQMIKLKDRFPAMNLYVMGHNHIKICTTQEGIDVRKFKGQWRMVSMVQGFVRSASFLKGYIEGEAVEAGQGSYAEEACLVPAGLGIVTANLRWKGHEGGFTLHVQE